VVLTLSKMSDEVQLALCLVKNLPSPESVRSDEK
jgi:hypothetical protein